MRADWLTKQKKLYTVLDTSRPDLGPFASSANFFIGQKITNDL
jgi:hypothetical protein